MRRVLALGLLAASAATVLGLTGCGDELTCVTPDLACQPLYEPTFDNVFATTLQQKCGTAGGSCHSRDGHKAGLILDDKATAYRALVEGGRVEPGAPSCSVLIERVYAGPSSLRMPPGKTLADAERCALLQWVVAGAPPPATP
jgi:hypothetical protein